MKRLPLLICLCLSFLLLLPLRAYAQPYTYTVTVYAGRQGSFVEGDPKVYSVSGLEYGEVFRFDYRSLVELPQGSKYEVYGIRESGKDNNTVSASAFYVTRDQEYVVAYRIPTDRVTYQVYFRESETELELMDPETYYGNDGDEVIVAFPYIEGYRPAALNGRWILHEGGNNDRVFYYTAIPVPSPQPSPEPEPEEPAPEETPEPEEIIEPTSPPEPTPVPEEILDLEGPRSPFTWKQPGEEGYETQMLIVCLGGTAVLAALVLLIFFLLRRKKKKAEEREKD